MNTIVAEIPVAQGPGAAGQPLDSPTSYSGSRYLFEEAARTFGVELESWESEGWRAMLKAAYVVDEGIDTDGVDIMPTVIDMFEGQPVEGMPPMLPEWCSAYMERQSENRYAAIINSLGKISGLVERQRQADKAKDLISIRLEEAELFAFFLALETAGRPDAARRHRLNEWLRGFSRCGYTIDSFIDLAGDYRSGSTSVRPTLGARTTLGCAALNETAAAIRKSPPRLLAKTALVAFKYEMMAQKPDLTDPNSDFYQIKFQ